MPNEVSPVSRIQMPADLRYPWYVRLIFRLQRRRYGRKLAPARLWGRTPRAFLAMSAMYGALDRTASPLDAALRSLVQVRVSQLNGCPFCTDINSASGLKRGLSAEKLAALPDFRSSPLYTEIEKAALDHAEAMTDTRRAGAGTIVRLRELMSENAAIELTALVAFQNMSSKFNAALGVEAQGFCPVH